MATFNDFVSVELPKRPFVEDDGAAGQILIRSGNPEKPRELVWTSFNPEGATTVLIAIAEPSGVEGGPFWYNPNTGDMKIYFNGSWINAFQRPNRDITSFTALADQSQMLFSYQVGLIDVYLNGLLQLPGTDYTADTGTEIIFTPALFAGDTVTITKY